MSLYRIMENLGVTIYFLKKFANSNEIVKTQFSCHKGVKISKILSSIKAVFTLLGAAKATMVAISDFLTFLTHIFLTKMLSFWSKYSIFGKKNTVKIAK